MALEILGRNKATCILVLLELFPAISERNKTAPSVSKIEIKKQATKNKDERRRRRRRQRHFDVEDVCMCSYAVYNLLTVLHMDLLLTDWPSEIFDD